MSNVRKWSGQGCYVTEIDGVEYEVEYDYEGYYDPGVCSGPVERCYPPEGDHEIDNIKITPEPPAELWDSLRDAAEAWSRENDEGECTDDR